MAERLYYVVDLRREFGGRYVTFWRPNNANYAYPLAWSGKYSLSELRPGYHDVKNGKAFIRFAVPCEVVEKMSCLSSPGDIDGGVYRIVVNDANNRRKLRAKRFDFAKALSTLTPDR